MSRAYKPKSNHTRGGDLPAVEAKGSGELLKKLREKYPAGASCWNKRGRKKK